MTDFSKPAVCRDWHDPAARNAYCDAVGVKAFRQEHADHRRRSIAATVNGHDILPFPGAGIGGRVYRIGDTDFPSLEAAERAARDMPPGEAPPPL